VPNFPDRVAAKAADVRPLRLLLSLLALPFYVLGIVVGVAWLAVRWTYAAVVVGFTDATDRRVTNDVG
jgi:hypothetical protein